jgi:hypothetical protein
VDINHIPSALEFDTHVGTLTYFPCIYDLALCVRHRVEEVEVELVTVAVASRVTFPTAVEARLGGVGQHSFSLASSCRRLLAKKLQKHAHQPPGKRHHLKITAMMGDLPLPRTLN